MLPKMRSPFVASMIMVAVTAGFGCVPTPTSGQDVQGDTPLALGARPSEAITVPTAMPDRGGARDALQILTNGAELHQLITTSDIPVLVYFSAEWCGPCQISKPYLEELALEEAHRVRVVGADVDTMAEFTLQHDVTSVPTTALFTRGHLVYRIVGTKSKQGFLHFLDTLLPVL